MRAPRQVQAPGHRARLLRGALLPAAAGAWAASAAWSERDPIEIALVIGFLILSLALHEVAHGWVALRRGDTTARDLGRLSLNPLVHIDPVWTLIVPLVTFLSSGFIFGGARPVPVNFFRLRHPLRDMALVAAAGPATNLFLAVVFLLAYKAAVHGGFDPERELLPRVLIHVTSFNVLLAVFNLIPIPPLDGSRILAWVLPAGLRPSYVALESFGMLAIVALIFFVPPFQVFLWSGIDATFGALDALTGGRW